MLRMNSTPVSPDDGEEQPGVMIREPLMVRAAVIAAVQAVLAALVGLGVITLDDNQIGLLVGAVGAVSALVVAVWSRPKLTPVDAPRDNDGNRLVPITEATNPGTM